MTEKSDDRRLPFAAHQGEGENACVIGPRDEILVECVHGSAGTQMQMASRIAAMLNRDLDNVHAGALELLTAGLKPTVSASLSYVVTRCRPSR